MKITFWKNNLISGEHQVELEQMIKDFIASDDVSRTNYLEGWPFERAIIMFMSNSYGSFDRLSDSQFFALKDELDLQTKAK